MRRQPHRLLAANSSQYLRQSPLDPFVVVTLCNPDDQYFGQSAIVLQLTSARLRLQLLEYNLLKSITRDPGSVTISQISLDRSQALERERIINHNQEASEQ